MLGLLLLAAAALAAAAALVGRAINGVRCLALAVLLVIVWAALPLLGMKP